jgi:SanA protein
MKRAIRWLKRFFVFLFLAFLILFLSFNGWIVESTRHRVFYDMDKLPDHRVALVLGTSHRTVQGKPNPFFEERIQMAATLYQQGKIDQFILSGDNRTRFYNEPAEMRRALIKKGVPASAITLDYAGLRTLDSIVRCKVIFGQDKITIITQPFHSYRALFISDFYKIDAVAMVAEEPEFEQVAKVHIREYFARFKAVLDLYVLDTNPRFLGEKEELGSPN